MKDEMAFPKEEERLFKQYLLVPTKASQVEDALVTRATLISSGKTRSFGFAAVAGLVAFSLVSSTGNAQAGQLHLVSSPAVAESAVASVVGPIGEPTLPDAPGFAGVSSSSAPVSEPEALFGGQTRTSTLSRPEASHFAKTIEPGQVAPRLTIGDKILLGIRENATYTSVGGWLLDASYEQIVNGSPNYGQTGKGFAQRLGAAAARNSSENIFSDSVIAPIMHQDPRYYRMGSGKNFFKRFAYAGTRGVITRTDGGRRTFNFSNVGGDLGGSALTQWYYPSINRSFTQVMQTWGGSVGGDAVGYLFAEFLPNLSGAFHHGN